MVRMNGSVIVPSFRIREEEAASAADANALGRGRAAEPVPKAARKTPRDRDTICVGTGIPGDHIDMRDHAAHTAILGAQRGSQIDKEALLQHEHRPRPVQLEQGRTVRTEKRRGGKKGVSTWRYRGGP